MIQKCDHCPLLVCKEPAVQTFPQCCVGSPVLAVLAALTAVPAFAAPAASMALAAASVNPVALAAPMTLAAPAAPVTPTPAERRGVWAAHWGLLREGAS
jgi:hypothetical protein